LDRLNFVRLTAADEWYNIHVMSKSWLGEALKTARQKAGLSQSEMAARLGIAQPGVARAESGRQNVTGQFIERWALATNAPIAMVFGAGLPTVSDEERARRSLILLGGRTFDPWERDPSPVEQATLIAEGFPRPERL
jgi:transcriptional regulator with XRE-family HTH domain